MHRIIVTQNPERYKGSSLRNPVIFFFFNPLVLSIKKAIMV